VVLYPTSDSDISKAVQWASKNKTDLAIMGGGHATAGASSSEGGIVIDLSKMRKVTVDAAKKTLTAQGGALWVDVDDAAQEHRLATVGGTVNHTGIGGLTLQGGYGWLSPQRGLVIDNLLSVRMVLADGSIVTASGSENPDLFWALRGAGSNFGVATEFVYQAFDQKVDPWCGLLAFTPDKLEAVIEFLNGAVNSQEGRNGVILGFACPPPTGGNPAVVAIVFYDSTEEEAQAAFKGLLDLEPVMNHTGNHPYNILNSITNALVDHGERKSTKGITYPLPLRPEFARQMFNEYAKFVAEVPDAIKTVVVHEYFSMKKIAAVPQDATAFANRGSYQNGMALLRWADPANDAVCRQWGRDVKVMYEAEAKKHRIEGEGVGIYSNYQEGESRSDICAYREESGTNEVQRATSWCMRFSGRIIRGYRS
jgi:hypothetical protein